MKKKRVIVLNICIILFIFLMAKLNYIDDILNYINFDTEKYSFKDLLSVIFTVLSIFIGFIVTCITVIVSMCDRRIIKLIKDMKKTKILYISMKNAVLAGVISLGGSALIYVNADFNLLPLRIFIIWIVMNSLNVFIYYSKILIVFINEIVKQIFFSNEDLVININLKE